MLMSCTISASKSNFKSLSKLVEPGWLGYSLCILQNERECDYGDDFQGRFSRLSLEGGRHRPSWIHTEEPQVEKRPGFLPNRRLPQQIAPNRINVFKSSTSVIGLPSTIYYTFIIVFLWPLF